MASEDGEVLCEGEGAVVGIVGGANVRLKDKVAIVTGSGRGIGKATAIAMAGEGATVVVNDIDGKAIDRVSKEIRVRGGKVLPVRADVTRYKQVVAMMDRVIRTFRRIDILVNNVGNPLDLPSSSEDVDERGWDRVMDLNLKAPFFCAKAVIKQMKKQRGGRIINISSTAGRSMGSYWTNCAYYASKAGISGLTRKLAEELGPYGITVNTVAPGTVWWMPPQSAAVRRRREEILKSVALRRIGRPEEIAAAVLFLASDEASYMTGAAVDVNGGRFMAP